MAIAAAVLILITSLAGFGDRAPDAVRVAAEEYLTLLRATCPVDPEPCMQKYHLDDVADLKRAKIGEPWAAFVLQYSDFAETPFQDLLKVAQFNYFACPIVVDDQFKGIVRVCTDMDDPDGSWTSCGARGPARLAEANTFNITLAPPEENLSVVCLLTVANNSRYIITRKNDEFYMIAASDMAADLMQKNVRHISKMTMFPLGESMYEIAKTINERGLSGHR